MVLATIRAAATPQFRGVSRAILSTILGTTVLLGLLAMHALSSGSHSEAVPGLSGVAVSASHHANALPPEPSTPTATAAADCGEGCMDALIDCMMVAMACVLFALAIALGCAARSALHRRLREASTTVITVAREVAHAFLRPDLIVLSISRT